MLKGCKVLVDVWFEVQNQGVSRDGCCVVQYVWADSRQGHLPLFFVGLALCFQKLRHILVTQSFLTLPRLVWGHSFKYGKTSDW